MQTLNKQKSISPTKLVWKSQRNLLARQQIVLNPTSQEEEVSVTSPKIGFCAMSESTWKMNKYELFETFLEFLFPEDSGQPAELNSVLASYWASLFKVLYSSYERQIVQYIY